MKSRFNSIAFASLTLASGAFLSAQTLYVPSGTSGIGSSSNGNVGIGTASPAASFDVNGAFRVTGGASAAGNYSVVAVGADGADRDIFLAGAAGLSNGFTVQRVGSAMKYVFNHGRVGVATDGPTETLDVNGVFRVGSADAQAIIALGNRGQGTGYYDTGIYRGSVGSLSTGNYLNLSGYAGIAFNSSAAALGSQSTRMYVDGASGNVGIGTTSPGARLDVQQSFNDTVIRSRSTTAGAWLVADSAADGYFGLRLESAGTPKWFVGSYDSSDLAIKRGNAVGTEALRIATTGNVGIGTTSPGSRRLNIQSSGADNDVGVEITLGRTTGTNYGLIVSAIGSGAAHNQGILTTAGNGSSNYGLRIYNVAAGSGNYALFSDSAAQSYFQGSVGIGTLGSAHKLAVNGTIRAKEVIVDTGWSDYVFADDYRLAPLSEVEAHIRDKRHLPGIPSAAEVAEQGISVGDMQAKLLAKVEELTLHAIEQQKALKSQQAEIAELRAENAGFRQQLSSFNPSR